MYLKTTQDYKKSYSEKSHPIGSSVAEWVRPLTSTPPLFAEGSNPNRNFEFFHVRKLSR
jgi:hypothetical protein